MVFFGNGNRFYRDLENLFGEWIFMIMEIFEESLDFVDNFEIIEAVLFYFVYKVWMWMFFKFMVDREG